MQKIFGLFTILLVLGCAAKQEIASVKEEPASNASVRLQFVPGSPPSNPQERSDTTWTALHLKNFTDENTYGLSATAVFDERFPVQQKDGPLLFEVVMRNGNDDHITLEITSDEGSQLLDLERDVDAHLDIGGARYRFRYPSIEVAASENKTNNNLAHIFISTPKV